MKCNIIKGADLGSEFYKHDLYAREGLIVGWGSQNAQGQTVIQIRPLGGTRYLLDAQLSRPVSQDEDIICTPPDADRWKSTDAAQWLGQQFKQI
tara:strand:+ start:138 stop:419 length:282 start_codon:yes stop_codon:yes gene_type:complete